MRFDECQPIGAFADAKLTGNAGGVQFRVSFAVLALVTPGLPG
jgi:hypothetical protein